MKQPLSCHILFLYHEGTHILTTTDGVEARNVTTASSPKSCIYNMVEGGGYIGLHILPGVLVTPANRDTLGATGVWFGIMYRDRAHSIAILLEA